jgi:hypothetical protein
MGGKRGRCRARARVDAEGETANCGELYVEQKERREITSRVCRRFNGSTVRLVVKECGAREYVGAMGEYTVVGGTCNK